MDEYEPITLDQLTTFLAVVEHRTFSAAARNVGRVQSAVSHGVATLERTLGTTLFDRGQRPPALTDAGRRLAAEARLVLAQARELRHVASAIREGLEPHLTLAVDSILPVDGIADVLAEFHETFPTVSLRLHDEVLDGAVALVRDGVAELGLCNLADSHEASLTALPGPRVRLVPVCAPTHPLANEPAPQRADRLQPHTQVVLSERATRTEDIGVISPRTWRVTHLGLKIELLLAGVGWGSAPLTMITEHLERGELVRLEPAPWADGRHDVQLHTVVRADRPLGPAGSWLRQRFSAQD